jgi:hypothetical protein
MQLSIPTAVFKITNIVGRVPLLNELSMGEFCVNVADGKMYTLVTYGNTYPVAIKELTGSASTGGTGGAWGTITGSITSQTDLVSYVGSRGFITGITSGNITTALGYIPYDGSANTSNFISSITSGNVTVALGYIPYNATNPSNFISGVTSGNVTTALGYIPENVINKDTDITLSANSDTRYASQKAIKTYVNNALSGVTVSDATSTIKGVLKLTNELGGTADLPTLNNTAVINKTLIGFTSGSGTVTSSDTLISAVQKLNGNISYLSTQVGAIQVGNNLFNYFNFI